MLPTIAIHTSETLIPSEGEAELAKQSSRILATYSPTEDTSVIQIEMKGKLSNQVVSLPTSVFRLLLNVLIQMSEGNAVTLIPIHAELTTQEAADLLNVSRPYLVKLLEEGKMPYRKIGMRRRILFKDLKEYKEKEDKERLKALEKMTEQSKILNLYT